MNKFKKAFVIISSVVIVSFLSIYVWRLNHYYHLYQLRTEKGILLYDKVLNDGLKTLYNKNETYYFHGNVNNNYVLYSGKLWRIVSLKDEKIKLILQDNVVTLSYGEKYENSLVRKWLNQGEENTGIFYRNVNADYIEKFNVCVDTTLEATKTCNKTVEDFVGLLSLDEFKIVGGLNSYLNNNTSWWISNDNGEGNWYVTPEGLGTSKYLNYQSYGVRPVVVLSEGVILKSGDGTASDPYTIEEREVTTLKNTYSGELINYSNYTWIITSVNSENVTLMLNRVMDSHAFGESNIFDVTDTNSLAYYLNNDFYSTLNKDVLFNKYYNGTYSNNYNYQDSYNEIVEAFVGLPCIGDMYSNKFSNVFLMNKAATDKTIYTISNLYNIYAYDSQKELGYVPVIMLPASLKIVSGDGYNVPYEIGETTNG